MTPHHNMPNNHNQTPGNEPDHHEDARQVSFKYEVIEKHFRDLQLYY